MFIPSIVPDPPSILRQTAYKNGVWAPEPVRDPAGWTSIAPIILRGTFEGREEVVKYTVRNIGGCIPFADFHFHDRRYRLPTL